jgi:hypothetical protein
MRYAERGSGAREVARPGPDRGDPKSLSEGIGSGFCMFVGLLGMGSMLEDLGTFLFTTPAGMGVGTALLVFLIGCLVVRAADPSGA